MNELSIDSFVYYFNHLLLQFLIKEKTDFEGVPETLYKGDSKRIRISKTQKRSCLKDEALDKQTTKRRGSLSVVIVILISVIAIYFG